MKNNNVLSLLLLAIIILFSACQKDELKEDQAKTQIEKHEQLFLPISEEEKKIFSKLGYNPAEVLKEIVSLPDGSTKEYFALDDILFSKEAIDTRLMQLAVDRNSKQWRTFQLVDDGEITIRGVNAGLMALSPQAKIGLQRAVNNYNALNLEISFALSFGSYSFSSDINVFTQYSSSEGGSASFPSNGQAGRVIRINSATSGSNDVFEHLVTHEIGHTVGMRHTDWFCRNSCSPVCIPESPSSYGVVWIPNTPLGALDTSSVFNACYKAFTDGELSHFDRIALREIY